MRISLKLFALLSILVATGCVSTPHGKMFPATAQAPDTATGEGCERFGVRQLPGITKVAANPVFQPVFVEAWEIDEYCPSNGRGMVWGCYHPDGKAYIVGRDAQVYWHEWCHAKLGPGHTRDSTIAGDYIGGGRSMAAGGG